MKYISDFLSVLDTPKFKDLAESMKTVDKFTMISSSYKAIIIRIDDQGEVSITREYPNDNSNS